MIGVFVLGGLVIYRSRDDESKEAAFTGTTEIFLLLLVLFSVIIMGVQNAIDRESINAIIGGIVGYVAGRARTRMSLPAGLFRGRERPAPVPAPVPMPEQPPLLAGAPDTAPAPEPAEAPAPEEPAAEAGEDATS
ncbi:MAG: hypothetical protein EHM39_01550 [Chloroflexi bacterium]|nr:MAG: hypothetical protein EHM39_01550 [Chloroflexota bacterium]